MPHPKLTDDAVSRLPLHGGRAELLEEIMSTPALDDTTAPAGEPRSRRSSRWLAPVAAAVAVGVLATAPAWWPEGDEQRVVGPAAPAPSLQSGHRAVLDAPGWTVEHTSEDPRYGGEVGYTKGKQSLDVMWSPAESYAVYVADREDISDPPAPGEPVEVLGIGGQLWHYSADDHTVIREVQAGHWMEFRGSGMDDEAFRALLASLRLVDREGLEASLPEAFITTDERELETSLVLEEIQQVSGAGLPRATPPITSDETDPYQFGAEVAGGYACAWLAAFADGDPRAQEVLATAREWPVLLRMDEQGDYPEVVWEYADEVAAGRVPEGYEDGLGCP